MMHDEVTDYPPIDPIKAGLQGCCPRCGIGKLFDGFLKIRPHCASCGLDYAFADAGDGPAVFVMMIIGFLVLGLALWFDATLALPLWAHALIWLPLTVILSLLLLRKLKGVMVALQYRNNASEGRIDHG